VTVSFSPTSWVRWRLIVILRSPFSTSSVSSPF